MRITLITAGTRGDVQPFIALGAGLKRAGFTVQVVAFEEFRVLAGAHGLDFIPLPVAVQELMNFNLAGMVDSGAAVFRLLPELLKLFRELYLQLTVDLLHACRGVDVLVSNTAAAMPAAAVAEKLGIPHIQTSVYPGWPTRAFPSIFFPWHTSLHRGRNRLTAALRGTFNWMTWFPAGWLTALGLRSVIERTRTDILHLPPRPPKRDPHPAPPVLAGFSGQVLPCPPDWAENIHVTGYWFLDWWFPS